MELRRPCSRFDRFSICDRCCPLKIVLHRKVISAASGSGVRRKRLSDFIGGAA